MLFRSGYRTQILEFIDMEHTPKNLLIRAVWDGKKNLEAGKSAADMQKALHVDLTLNSLLD